MHLSNEPALVAQKEHLETISSIFMVVVIFLIVFICSKVVPCPKNYAYFSSSSFKSPLTFSVTLKPPNSQSLPCRPQCEVEAGEGLCFLGSCCLEVGLNAIGESAGSEVVRFAGGIAWAKFVLIRGVLVVLFGGEGRGPGDFDLDRERRWKMVSVGDGREKELLGKANGKERDRECEMGEEIGELVAELDIVLTSSGWRTPGTVIGCVEGALGEDEDEVCRTFIPLVRWSAANEEWGRVTAIKWVG
jgi:hypothetical protein